MAKICYIIAGPNGAGKTTFATEFLSVEARGINFINADIIAARVEPLQPEKAGIRAGKIMLNRINEYIKKGDSFAFETTLSGKTYLKKIEEMKLKGYEVILYYLKLATVELAIERVKLRVAQGGHNIPEKDIRRRFERSWINFNKFYKALVDRWIIFDTSNLPPKIIDKSE